MGVGGGSEGDGDGVREGDGGEIGNGDRQPVQNIKGQSECWVFEQTPVNMRGWLICSNFDCGEGVTTHKWVIGLLSTFICIPLNF